MTRAPKIGTSSPIPDTLMMYDHRNPLLCHHSNQLLTHSLTIGKKIERPRRSLRSLWGLITQIFPKCVGIQAQWTKDDPAHMRVSQILHKSAENCGTHDLFIDHNPNV